MGVDSSPTIESPYDAMFTVPHKLGEDWSPNGSSLCDLGKIPKKLGYFPGSGAQGHFDFGRLQH